MLRANDMLQMTPMVRARTAASLALLVGFIWMTTACASGGDETPTPTPTPKLAATRLVGAWSSTDAGDATFAYRFDSDGTYAWVGVVTQPRSAGVFTLTIEADGGYSVDGDQLLLKPSQATRTRDDPEDPKGNYVDQPFEMESSSLEWAVLEPDRLTLSDENGVQHYQRER